MSMSIQTKECKFVGKTYKVADTVFVASNGLYACKLDDFTLLTNFDCTSLLDTLPDSLKSKIHKRWQYVMHVSHGMELSVNRKLLYARVIGGEILGYKFMECSIDGNQCAYYGFIQSQEKNSNILTNCHRNSRFTMMAVFPRRLYVYIEQLGMCTCETPGCIRLQALNLSGSQKSQFCSRDIPWHKLYVMMGELDDKCVEQVKEARECAICAQCYNCSKSVGFCRSHRVCKHRGSRSGKANDCSERPGGDDDDEPKIKIPKIKNCRVLKK